MKAHAPTLRRRWLLAAVAAPALAAIPTAAAAGATITADQVCAKPGQDPNGQLVNRPLVITGAGFTPGAIVPINYGGTPANALVGADGSFVTGLNILSRLDLDAPKSSPLDIVATDPAAGAVATRVRTAPLAFSVTPRSGQPSVPKTYKFSGFTPDQPIYGHFRFNGKLRASVKLGRASNPCGLLTVRRAFPVRNPNTGIWKVQYSQSKTFKAQSVPRLDAEVTISTRIVRR